MAEEIDPLAKLRLDFVELLSEYGVDRAGIDAAIDLAIEHGDSESIKGYNVGYDDGNAT